MRSVCCARRALAGAPIVLGKMLDKLEPDLLKTLFGCRQWELDVASKKYSPEPSLVVAMFVDSVTHSIAHDYDQANGTLVSIPRRAIVLRPGDFADGSPLSEINKKLWPRDYPQGEFGLDELVAADVDKVCVPGEPEYVIITRTPPELTQIATTNPPAE